MKFHIAFSFGMRNKITTNILSQNLSLSTALHIKFSVKMLKTGAPEIIMVTVLKMLKNWGT